MQKLELYTHASTVVREAVRVPEDDEACVAQTLPLVFKFRTIGPKEFKDLFLGSAQQWST